MTLDSALDAGITEAEYWEMTLGEVIRRLESYIRVRKQNLQLNAYYFWQLGNLIGISVGRLLSSSSEYPSIYDAFPAIFDEETVKEAEEDARMKASYANFMQYAANHNLKFKMKKEGGNS